MDFTQGEEFRWRLRGWGGDGGVLINYLLLGNLKGLHVVTNNAQFLLELNDFAEI